MKHSLITYRKGGLATQSMLLFFLTALLFFSCEDKPKKTSFDEQELQVDIPNFNADSAYEYVAKQVAFGPRVPNMGSHINCGEWLGKFLEDKGAKVFRQTATVTAWDGTQLSAQNIIAQYNPEAKKRILLSAHWDTRPIADQDTERQNEPILGANDGASGVGVLLEIARQIQAKKPTAGIDICLWDAEDYGNPGTVNSYSLGTQYWAKNKHVPNYNAAFGINLDMVGAAGAQFFKEENSMNYAAAIVEKVWLSARRQGYGSYFSHVRGNAVTDDHFYVSKLAGIPCIDVIDQKNGADFFEQWHTHGDDMSVISKETLKAVGQTVLDVIYRE